MSAKRVGELLIEQNLISPENLQEALELQKVFPDLTIGQLLCKLGFIKESDLGLVLDHKNKRQKLTDILLKGGLIDQQKLWPVSTICHMLRSTAKILILPYLNI